jgi:hypothetical protein
VRQAQKEEALSFAQIILRAKRKEEERREAGAPATIADMMMRRLYEVDIDERLQVVKEWATSKSVAQYAEMRRDIARQWLDESGIRIEGIKP